MKVDPDSDLVADLLDSEFESSLPPPSTLAAAYANPNAAEFTKPENLGRALAATSIAAFRRVAAGIAVDVGVPVDVFEDFGRSLSVAGADQAVNGWVDFIGTAQSAIIDVALNAMGAVPFVGWIAKAGKAAIDAIMAAAAAKAPKPALIVYAKDDDEFQARETIKALRGDDWTSIFRPGWSTDGKLGDWGAPVEQDTGYLWKPREKFAVGGLGCVPGGAFGSGGVQSRNAFTPQMGDSKEKIHRRSVACILNTYDTTPSLARVCLAAWQSMTAQRTASLFNVDTRGIADEWQRYCDSAIATARLYQSESGKGMHWYFEMAARNLENAMYVRGFKIVDRAGNPIPQRTATLADVARGQLENLRERQESGLTGPLAAYASSKQPAFRDQKLLEELVGRRVALLSSPRRWLIKRKDIIDADYLEAFVDATPESQRPKDPPVGRLPPMTPPRPLPEPELGEEGSSAGWVVVGVLGLAAAAGIGYVATRSR